MSQAVRRNYKVIGCHQTSNPNNTFTNVSHEQLNLYDALSIKATHFATCNVKYMHVLSGVQNRVRFSNDYMFFVSFCPSCKCQYNNQ